MKVAEYERWLRERDVAEQLAWFGWTCRFIRHGVGAGWYAIFGAGGDHEVLACPTTLGELEAWAGQWFTQSEFDDEEDWEPVRPVGEVASGARSSDNESPPAENSAAGGAVS